MGLAKFSRLLILVVSISLVLGQYIDSGGVTTQKDFSDNEGSDVRSGGLPEVTPVPQNIVSYGYTVDLDSSWTIVVNTSREEDVFSAEELSDFLKNAHNVTIPILDLNDVTTAGTKADTHRILLGTPASDSRMAETVLSRRLFVSPELGGEGYVLEITEEQIIIAANAPAGVFYGVKTLKQLIDWGPKAYAVSIRDWPESPIRGAYINGPEARLLNAAYIKSRLDVMAENKMNLGILATPGFYFLHYSTTLQTLWEIKDYSEERHIEFVPELASGDGGPVYSFNANVAEGLWVQNETFSFLDDYAEAKIPVEVPWPNPSFEIDNDENEVPDSWSFVPGTHRTIEGSLDTTEAYEGSRSVKMSLPQPPGHLNSSSYLMSDYFPVLPDSTYHVSFMAKAVGIEGARRPQVTMPYEFNETKASFGSGFGSTNVENSDDWKEYHFTLRTASETRYAKIYSRVMHDGMGTWWLDDFKVYRLDGALFNVIRTNSTEITLRSVDGNVMHTEGVDYAIENSSDPNKVAYFELRDRMPYRIRRLPGGSISNGETVLVSYDFLPGPMGWARESNVPNCFAEPLLYDLMEEEIDDVMNTFHPKYINFGYDEIRGIGRDSRSILSGLNNSELIAVGMNALTEMVKAKDPDARPLFWDDMVRPRHNGGDRHYQEMFGGREGATMWAGDLLDKDIIFMNWWYGADDDKGKMANSTAYYSSMGFGWVGNPEDDKDNIRMWGEIIDTSEEALGLIGTDWDLDFSGIPMTGWYAWNHLNVTKPLSDLVTSADDIELPHDVVNIGDNVDVRFTIHNKGRGSAENVVFEIFLNDMDTGEAVYSGETDAITLNSSAKVDFTFTAQDSGPQEILIVVNRLGEIFESTYENNQATTTLLVNSPPGARIDCPLLAYVNESIHFRGSESIDSDGMIAGFEWDFGDGAISEGAEVGHIYLEDGTYEVRLTVTDDGGAVGTSTMDMEIMPLESHQEEQNQDVPWWQVAAIVGTGLLLTTLLILSQRKKR